MNSNIKKLFQKSLNIKSFFNEHENSLSSSTRSHLKEFNQQISHICIFPVGIRENHPGIYNKYLEKTLSHISQLQDINFDYALNDPKISEGVPNLSKNKKTLF